MVMSLKEAFDAMEYDELMKIKIDLENGGTNIRKLVVQKAKQKEMKHDPRCASCSNEINAYSTSNYTLLFGPEDFKKKASFCGIDCMQYFIERMRYKNLGNLKENNERSISKN
jgi:hypothetical protein